MTARSKPNNASPAALRSGRPDDVHYGGGGGRPHLPCPIPPELPDIGSPASAMLSGLGRVSARAPWSSSSSATRTRILEDPEVTEYLNALGLAAGDPGARRRAALSALRREGLRHQRVRVAGRLHLHQLRPDHRRRTPSRSWRVSWRTKWRTSPNITSRARSARRANRAMTTTAAMLAAILLGALGGGGGQAIEGGIAAAQGLAVQQQINFTRDNEAEADRVGIGFLAGAGFDTRAMANFFETIGRTEGLAGDLHSGDVAGPPGYLGAYRRSARARRAVRPAEGEGIAELPAGPRAGSRSDRARRPGYREVLRRRDCRRTATTSAPATAKRWP